MADTKDPGRVRLCAASPGPFSDTLTAIGNSLALMSAAADHGAMLAGAEAIANAQDQRLRDAAPDLLDALRQMLAPYHECSDNVLRSVAQQPDDRWFGVISPKMARAVLHARDVVAGATAP